MFAKEKEEKLISLIKGITSGENLNKLNKEMDAMISLLAKNPKDMINSYILKKTSFAVKFIENYRNCTIVKRPIEKFFYSAFKTIPAVSTNLSTWDAINLVFNWSNIAHEMDRTEISSLLNLAHDEVSDNIDFILQTNANDLRDVYNLIKQNKFFKKSVFVIKKIPL